MFSEIEIFWSRQGTYMCRLLNGDIHISFRLILVMLPISNCWLLRIILCYLDMHHIHEWYHILYKIYLSRCLNYCFFWSLPVWFSIICVSVKKHLVIHIIWWIVKSENMGILTLIARFMGPTWGPSGADKTHVGPLLASWTLLSGKIGGISFFFERGCKRNDHIVMWEWYFNLKYKQ